LPSGERSSRLQTPPTPGNPPDAGVFLIPLSLT
jgi:hypothetical protein